VIFGYPFAMPIYEFYSPDTNRIYSFFARSLAQGRAVPRCPDDPSARMERVISRFAVTGRAKDREQAPIEANDPRMERAMMEMEREMSSLSEETPDPRALGRLMRKMTAATGKDLPPAMQQMLERLEKGEDPDKLEEEYGEIMEDMEEEFGGENEAAEKAGPAVRRKAPERDPALHEMSDYL
jgi:hypothetical protein